MSQPYRQPSFLEYLDIDSVHFEPFASIKGNYPVVYPTVRGKYARMTSRLARYDGRTSARRSARYDCAVVLRFHTPHSRGLHGLFSTFIPLGDCRLDLLRPIIVNSPFMGQDTLPYISPTFYVGDRCFCAHSFTCSRDHAEHETT